MTLYTTQICVWLDLIYRRLIRNFVHRCKVPSVAFLRLLMMFKAQGYIRCFVWRVACYVNRPVLISGCMACMLLTMSRLLAVDWCHASVRTGSSISRSGGAGSSSRRQRCCFAARKPLQYNTANTAAVFKAPALWRRRCSVHICADADAITLPRLRHFHVIYLASADVK